MAGTGYFDAGTGVYRALSVETWADYTEWDSFTDWVGTADLPLQFTTAVSDYGSSTLLNFTVNAETSDAFSTTVSYSDSIDSAGELVSPSTVTILPNSTDISAIKARYWQFTIEIDADSAGELIDPNPTISSLTTSLSEEQITRTQSNIDSLTLPGSVGLREFTITDGISTVTSLITQAQVLTNLYVQDGYVESGYVVSEQIGLAVIRVEKSTPIILHIVDASTAVGSATDCVFDAIITGLPAMTSDGNGNINQVL